MSEEENENIPSTFTVVKKYDLAMVLTVYESVTTPEARAACPWYVNCKNALGWNLAVDEPKPETLWDLLGFTEQDRAELHKDLQAIRDAERRAWVMTKDVRLV